MEEHKDYSPSSDLSEVSSSDETPKKKGRMKKITNKFQQEHVAVVGQELKNYTLQPNIGQ